MGRPYKNEVHSLPDTYQWAVSQDCRRLRHLMRDQKGKTLIAVGSGGSYSTAVAAVALHRFIQRSPAYAITPLELEAAALEDCNSSVWLFSGSGRNIDIRRALKASLPNESNQLTISKPCQQAGQLRHVDCLNTIGHFESIIAGINIVFCLSLYVSTGVMKTFR